MKGKKKYTKRKLFSSGNKDERNNLSWGNIHPVEKGRKGIREERKQGDGKEKNITQKNAEEAAKRSRAGERAARV